MIPRRPPLTDPARLKRAEFARIWNAVEGAVVDAMQQHPEYYTDAGRKHMVVSVTKRAVGSLIATLTREGGGTVRRSADADNTGVGEATPPDSRGRVNSLPAPTIHRPGLWCWPSDSLDRRNRRLLRNIIAKSRLRFVALHRAGHGIVYVEVGR
jgi:hypothetical protein